MTAQIHHMADYCHKAALMAEAQGCPHLPPVDTDQADRWLARESLAAEANAAMRDARRAEDQSRDRMIGAVLASVAIVVGILVATTAQAAWLALQAGNL